MLFAASLYRPGREKTAAHVLVGLYRRYGNDIFKLNRLPYEPLRDEIAALCPGGDAEDLKGIPGVLRSVCDFFYRVGPLDAWLAAAPDWETRAGELCGEIHRMGLHSRSRTRARWFFWLASHQPGFAERYPQAAAFAWPVGQGHLRFLFDIVKPPRGRAAATPEERLEAFMHFAREVFPGEPWRLFRPLDSFLQPVSGGGYFCREVQGLCRTCPLAVDCPASRNFIPSEAAIRQPDNE